MNLPTRLPAILLIEDNIDDYEATARSFRKANFLNPLHWCSNARDGIDFLRRSGKYANDKSVERPGLILLDLNMPGMDGRVALKTIKADPGLRSIPVIILTTSADDRDIEHCYASGASTYIQKPVGFGGLVEAAHRMKDYWFGVALLPTRADFS